MPVRFTVDAHEGQMFFGKVTQIRMNAQMTQNVVTYTVVVTTDNSDGKLLPYLTSNVQFESDKKSNVLLVPNAALRWTPQNEQVAATADKTAIAAEVTTPGNGRLWVVAPSGLVRPLGVTVGASDGTKTEISGNDVKDGMRVVAGEEGNDETAGQASAADGETTSNPFSAKTSKGEQAASWANVIYGNCIHGNHSA